MLEYRWSLNMIVILFALAGVWGCTMVSPSPEKLRPTLKGRDFVNVQVRDLAGVWEYEEANVVYPLTFDQEGNGAYEWKQGRFRTTSLKDGIWVGTWHQEENDREGGFEVRLGHDLHTATGRWWYTRIEQDHDPLNPGGTFTLRRVPLELTEN